MRGNERTVNDAASWAATLRLIRTAAPGWTTAWLCLLLVQGVLPAAVVYCTKLLVDRLVLATGSGLSWDVVPQSLPLVGLLAALLLSVELLQGAVEWVRTAHSELIQDYVRRLIHQQAAAVDISFYETADWNDRLYQVCTNAAARPLSLLENAGGAIQNGITLVAFAAILVPYSPWLPVVLLLSTLPSFLVVMRFDRRYHAWWQRTTADRRWAQYYDALLTHKDAALELRLFGLSGYFSSAYQRLRRRLHAERMTEMRKQSLAKLAAGLLTLLISGAASVWMVLRTLQGLASLGDLVLLYQAFSRGQGIMRSLLASLGHILTNHLYLTNLFEFLSVKPRITDPVHPVRVPAALRRGISFEDVTFRYPGSQTNVLENFNLYVPAGNLVAIVGPNGAGKTTVLKLLSRFYDVDAGRVALDGIDVRDVAQDDLRRALTMLFQLPVPYHATAGESIALGDIGADPTRREIESAARSAGAHEVINRLPQGYDTLLGKWYASGVELSTGEQQRIALARAYLRRAPIVLLDEPTSFIDSWAEAQWFQQFRALTLGRTAIIITHRFTIARRADMIHVMDDGRIVESGSHADLVRSAGLYAQSWAAQTQAVVSDTSGSTTSRTPPAARLA